MVEIVWRDCIQENVMVEVVERFGPFQEDAHVKDQWKIMGD